MIKSPFCCISIRECHNMNFNKKSSLSYCFKKLCKKNQYLHNNYKSLKDFLIKTTENNLNVHLLDINTDTKTCKYGNDCV